MKEGGKIKEKILSDGRVDEISDERSNGDGVWVYLKTPYANYYDEPWGGLHLIHKQTYTDCLKALKRVKVCGCEYCK